MLHISTLIGFPSAKVTGEINLKNMEMTIFPSVIFGYGGTFINSTEKSIYFGINYIKNKVIKKSIRIGYFYQSQNSDETWKGIGIKFDRKRYINRYFGWEFSTGLELWKDDNKYSNGNIYGKPPYIGFPTIDAGLFVFI